MSFPEDSQAPDAEEEAAAGAPEGAEDAEIRPVNEAPEGYSDAEPSAEAAAAEAENVEAVEAVETVEAVEVESSDAEPIAETVEPAAAAPDAEQAEEAVPVWTPEPDKLICAVLFASQEYLGVRALKEILGDEFDAGRIRKAVKQINQQWREADMPFEVVEVDATFRVRTLPKYFPWVRKLFKDANPRRLSQASLETLAIIAYKQPITKAEIEAIRGVNVDGCMKSLMEKKLVDVNGRSDAVGSAFTYSTTREFMRYFGISRVPDDLPRLSEFEAIVNAQALIPQVGADGNLVEMAQPEPDGEQLTMGQLE